MSYSVSENRLQKLAKDVQKMTLAQVIIFNQMSDNNQYGELKAYIEDSLPQSSVLSQEQVCKLWWEINRIHISGALWYLNNVISQLEKGFAVRLGVPPPIPPPPPPNGD